MKITVFAKKKKTEDGRTFYTFLTTLHRDDGSEQVVQVAFDEDTGKPKPENCPINIEFDKTDANMSGKKYTDQNGDTKESKTLWIKKWKPSIDVYVDHSLDEFVD